MAKIWWASILHSLTAGCERVQNRSHSPVESAPPSIFPNQPQTQPSIIITLPAVSCKTWHFVMPRSAMYAAFRRTKRLIPPACHPIRSQPATPRSPFGAVVGFANEVVSFVIFVFVVNINNNIKLINDTRLYIHLWLKICKFIFIFHWPVCIHNKKKLQSLLRHPCTLLKNLHFIVWYYILHYYQYLCTIRIYNCWEKYVFILWTIFSYNSR